MVHFAAGLSAHSIKGLGPWLKEAKAVVGGTQTATARVDPTDVAIALFPEDPQIDEAWIRRVTIAYDHTWSPYKRRPVLVGHPRPGVVVVSTDAQLLAETIDRAQDSTSQAAGMPSHLRGLCRHTDTRARFWTVGRAYGVVSFACRLVPGTHTQELQIYLGDTRRGDAPWRGPVPLMGWGNTVGTATGTIAIPLDPPATPLVFYYVISGISGYWTDTL